MQSYSTLLLKLAFLVLFNFTLLGPCDSVRTAREISHLEVRRTDNANVHLALWATPSDTPKYYVEFNGEKYNFAGGGIESTYACLVQSPDGDRVVVLQAFRGAPRGVIELDLRTGESRDVGGGPIQWLKNYERDGWTRLDWPNPLDPRTGKPRGR